MKLGKILAEGNFSKYLEEARKADLSVNQSRNIFEKGSAFIRKFKYQADTKWYMLFPLEMVLPFNPEDLEDTSINENNPMVLPGSVGTAVQFIKSKMQTNEDFKQRILEILRVEESALNLDTVTCKDMNEGRIWHRLARIQYILGYTQKLNDGKYPNPSTIGCNVTVDGDGVVNGSVGVGYYLHVLENALMSLKIQEVTEQYGENGEYADRSEDDYNTAIKSIKENRIISNPRISAYTRIIVLKGKNNEGDLSSEFLDDWEKFRNISKYDRYIHYTTKMNDILTPVLTSKKYDTCLNCIEACFSIPAENPANKQNIYTEAQLAPSSISTSCFNPESNNKNFGEEILIEIDKYMSDTTIWNNETLKRSVRELRVKSDADLYAVMKNTISKYDNCINNKEIQSTYGNLISSINSELVASFAEAMLDGKEDKHKVDNNIIQSLPKESGFGSEDETDDDSGFNGGDDLAAQFDNVLNSTSDDF